MVKELIFDIYGRPIDTPENFGTVLLTIPDGTVTATIKNIWGKAKVLSSGSLVPDALWIWLEPEKTLGSVTAFGISLPPIHYTRDELMATIAKEGSRRAQSLLKDFARDQVFRKGVEDSQFAMDSLANEMKSLLK